MHEKSRKYGFLFGSLIFGCVEPGDDVGDDEAMSSIADAEADDMPDTTSLEDESTEQGSETFGSESTESESDSSTESDSESESDGSESDTSESDSEIGTDSS